ncbi:MAG: AAA family ATPase [Candidatus Aminicenantes bacterium]|nr:AAA family ATPase [Candidatus Aminicenantes bacterium]NIM83191.1 AAA family ATPase [Candidatus Aminicenantes bacterium]NIN22570.1 AAA family ATPase [Candidatus Aminicenantes bacterium]NIN46339.1 AAA family ATPase [Candidatus Aminicenantes bacterium]NIN89180.1 AAA family ATPase [Candidatus Aminicenantes bacterium]
MGKYFNTAGLCFPDEHYMVDPLSRLRKVENLIARKRYFTIHAPRQTGKTTYLHAVSRKLNTEGKYISLAVSFERAGYNSISVDEANRKIIHNIYSASVEQLAKKYWPENPKGRKYLDLKEYLQTWARAQSDPIVLFIDEIDSLMNDVLISVLRQLRDGYQSRPGHFPSSVALVGLRDVRDYKVESRNGIKPLGTASPFNVKSDSLLISNFTKEEVFQLLDQHTTETGQVFPGEVKEEIFSLTQGQPWLTNALAYQIVSEILEDDYSKTITVDILNEARKQLVLRRDTHLDSLVDRLKEEWVKQIVQAIINGDSLHFDILDDHISYVRDLGIVSQTSPLEFANPIYAEIIPGVMASPIQESIPKEVQTSRFVDRDGNLDMEKVLKEFQVFYRRNSGMWLDRYEYKESAHHLLLMSYLQRLVNAGGEINHEMALGNKRIDMRVKYGNQEFALELKIKRGNYTIEEGKQQLNDYLDIIGLKEGYLVIFDPADIEWENKIYWKKTVYKNKTIIMVGL